MNCDWKIHKKLMDGGGLGPVVYVIPARCDNRSSLVLEHVEELLASGRTVVYGRPGKSERLQGSRSKLNLRDRDILTLEQYERAERILKEYLKTHRSNLALKSLF